RDTLLFQAVAVPIVVPGAAPVGVLVATKLLDRQMALDVRAATAADIVFYALDAHGKPHVAATSLDSARQAAAALPAPAPNDSVIQTAGPRAARTALIGRSPFVLQGAALSTAGGEIVGGFVVARPESETSAQLAGIRRSLFVAGLLGLALALAAAWSSARGVTRPTRALAAAAAHALEGKYDAAARIAGEAMEGAPASEVAALGAVLTAFLEELREKQALGALVGRAGPNEPLPNDQRLESTDDWPRASRTRSNASRGRTPLAPRLAPQHRPHARLWRQPWRAVFDDGVRRGHIARRCARPSRILAGNSCTRPRETADACARGRARPGRDAWRSQAGQSAAGE